MLSLGILLGLVLGLLAGGSLANLASVRLRWVSLIAAAVIVRFGTEAALLAGVPLVETLRLPLLAAAFGILLVGLWANRSYPGLTLAFVGILSNGIVIVVNGGYMPIWEPSLIAAGFTPGGRLHGDPHALRPGARAVPPPPRAARRHHPDPVPDDPERRLDRRRLPDRRPGLLPLRERRPRAQRPRRRGGGAHQRAARGDQRRRIRPVAGVRGIRGPRAADHGGQPAWRPGLARPSRRSRSHGPRSPSGSGATRMSGSPSTAPSRRCGSASSSRCSATGSTSSPWPRWCWRRPARRSRPASRSSSPPSRTCSSRRSPARSSTAGTARRS